MATLASLAIDLVANSAQLVNELQKVNRHVDTLADKAQKAGDLIKKSFMGALAVSALKQYAETVLRTSAEFETLKASLESVYGSQEKASLQFKKINDFASSTPFTIQQVTEAAIKMKALGLDPSTKALESMGNTASAMGKPLMQFVEAVADAATGEMERLKEFGIKTRKEGDSFTFTFQGVEKTVTNSSIAIQNYLMEIGNVNFAGAITRQSNTLSGVLSTLGGAVDNLKASFADKSGLTEAVKSAAKWLTEIFNRIATGSPSIAALQRQLDELNNTPLIMGGQRNAAKKRAEQIRAITNEITRLKAEAGDIASINRMIETTGAALKAAQNNVPDGAGTTTGAGKNKKTIGIVELKEVERVKGELSAYKELLVSVRQAEAEAAAASEAAASDENKKNKTDKLQESLNALQNRLQTEREMVDSSFVEEMALLEEGLAKKRISEENFYNQSQRLRAKYYNDLEKMDKKKNALEEQADKNRLRDKESFFKDLASLGTSNSKVLFNISKVAAIAQGVLDMRASVMSAYKYGASIGGPAMGAAFAAVSGAAQLSNLAALASTQVGGSGGGSGGGGGGSFSVAGVDAVNDAVAEAPEVSKTKVVTLNIQGLTDDALLTKNQLRQIVDQINDEETANVKIVGL